MAQTLAEFLENAPRRDEKYAERRRVAEAHDDAYFDTVSELVDEHPIGKLMGRFS